MSYIIAYSGSHGTRKTTAVYEMASYLKTTRHHQKIGVLSENIIECPFPVNQAMTRESQLWIFTNHIQAELSMLAKYDIVINDRTSVDSIGYTVAAGFHDLAEAMLEMVRHHMDVYRFIFFRSIASNNFVNEDGLRDTDREFRSMVECALLNVYSRLKLRPGVWIKE